MGQNFTLSFFWNVYQPLLWFSDVVKTDDAFYLNIKTRRAFTSLCGLTLNCSRPPEGDKALMYINVIVL